MIFIQFQEEVDAAVKKLLDLKIEFKNVTGEDYPAPTKTPAKPKEAKSATKEKCSKEKVAPIKKTANVNFAFL